MLHPETEVRFVSPAVGRGVFATARIPRGTIVWTQDSRDRVFPASDLPGLDPELLEELRVHGHRDAQGGYILCWDGGRLVNHACDPNLRGVGPWFMVARRDIAPGEEVTCDYAECNLEAALECACESPNCRGRVDGRDLLLRLGETFDAESKDLLAATRAAPQPLWPHLLDPAQASAWIEEREPLPAFADQCARSARSRDDDADHARR